ncbi:septal ring lytic transglycosylase RlpA family protein [Herbaspirillum sp. HC18]|nr:septal ring lytic transglycosylase RlpA family protein [Herbaspirillum sp. HC18]
MRNTNKCRKAVVLALALSFGTAAWADAPDKGSSASSRKHNLDRSGKPRTGKASYYGKEFHGKKMADGTPMNPESNIAASKTLPLGTKAQVTNLENGKSEVVEIRDRGPYVAGRIVDVSPKVAEKLEMKRDGVATVEVKPLEIPTAERSSGQ